MRILPTYSQCQSLYEFTNVAGRVTGSWCDERAWVDAGVSRRQAHEQHRYQHPMPAGASRLARVVESAQDRGVESLARWQRLVGVQFSVSRAWGSVASTLFLDGVVYLGLGLGAAGFAKYLLLEDPSLAELVTGRGQTTPSPRLGLWGLRHLAQAHHAVAHHGLLGSILELPGTASASALHRRGHDNWAALCLLGACAGRIVLQVPRLVIAACMLLRASIIATVYLAGLVLLETVLQLERGISGIKGHFVANTAAHQTRQARRMRDLDSVRAMPTSITGSPMAAVPPLSASINDPHATTQKFANAVIDSTFPAYENIDDAKARTLADSAAEALRAYCRHMPDSTAYLGGLYLLQSFMDLTYTEAAWRPNPDILLERFLERELEPLRALNLQPAAAVPLADRIAAKVHDTYNGVAEAHALAAARTALQRAMSGRFGAAVWSLPPLQPAA